MTSDELEDFMDWLGARAAECREQQHREAWLECYGKDDKVCRVELVRKEWRD